MAEDKANYSSGGYFRTRNNLLYYDNFYFIMRCIAAESKSLIDVGSGNSPYLEWFDWIPRRVSVDIRSPYSSPNVEGIKGDIHKLEFTERFDICSCLQVIEHVPEPQAFARRLLTLGNLLLLSVPYKWPLGHTAGHLHDPIDEELVQSWFGVKPNWSLLVQEPFLASKGQRMFFLFDPADYLRKFGAETRTNCRPRTSARINFGY